MKQKRKSKYLMLVDYNSLSKEEIILEIDVIRNKLKNIMKSHIGKDNAISPYDLFINIFNIDPREMNIYTREYWWNIVKKVMRNLRYYNEMFIVTKSTKVFVLKSWDEYKSYEKQINNTINELKNSKNKAYHWVKNESWRRI